jgi:hypothetical protein
MTDEELIKQYRDQQAALNGGCSDGYCVIAKTVGMHTNGGRSCLSNLDFWKRQRVGVMLKTAQAMADRIEELVKQLDETHEEAMEFIAMWGAALKSQRAAEAKLAKAMSLLEAAFCEGFAEGYDGGWVEGDYTHAWKKSDTLAELEKSE